METLASSTTYQSLESKDRLASQLEEAIQTGDAATAKKLLAVVVNGQLKLECNISEYHNSQQFREKEFIITVQVEDRVSRGANFELSVKPSDSISYLKRRVWLLHNFPIEKQKWIIGKKIPDDKATLKNCGVSGSGHTLFLYLVTSQPVAQSGKLENGAAHRTKKISNVNPPCSMELSSKELTFDGQPKPPLLMNENVQSKANKAVEAVCQSEAPVHNAYDDDVEQTKVVVPNVLMQVIPPTASLFQPIQEVNKLQPKIEDKPGWHCPMCTFLNLPTRPGCEMCCTGRPDEYIVPDNYQMTDQEMAMRMNQDELERMTRQGALDDSSNPLSAPLASGQRPSTMVNNVSESSLHKSLYHKFLKKNPFSDAASHGSSSSAAGAGGTNQSYSFLQGDYPSDDSDCPADT